MYRCDGKPPAGDGRQELATDITWLIPDSALQRYRSGAFGAAVVTVAVEPLSGLARLPNDPAWVVQDWSECRQGTHGGKGAGTSPKRHRAGEGAAHYAATVAVGDA